MQRKIKLHQKAITLLSCIEQWKKKIADEKEVAKFHKHYVNTSIYMQCLKRIANYESYIAMADKKYHVIINQIN